MESRVTVAYIRMCLLMVGEVEKRGLDGEVLSLNVIFLNLYLNPFSSMDLN